MTEILVHLSSELNILSSVKCIALDTSYEGSVSLLFRKKIQSSAKPGVSTVCEQKAHFPPLTGSPLGPSSPMGPCYNRVRRRVSSWTKEIVKGERLIVLFSGQEIER